MVAHLVLTVFENLPDDKLPLKMRLPFFPGLPQWRFFAPNPGIEDLYVFYRSRSGAGQPWSSWEDLSIANRASPWAMIWNPGSRVPKALFDMASQVRTLALSGATLEWVKGSDGYTLIADTVRTVCVKKGLTGQYQFMILAAVPTEGRDGIKPIVVSSDLAVLTEGEV
ncbi:hypothetical protein AB0D24_04185 [Streptomyces javensis]|uniref:hypothetical protein n=1 Tax=Streptomyces javensis TaxID=114698 RepID=UPI0033C7778C